MTDHVPYKLTATRRIMRRNLILKKIAVSVGVVASGILIKKIARHQR